MTIPIILGWSGGKDSALALNSLLADARYEVVCLLTTLTRDFDRISMHGVRRNLLLRQTASSDCHWKKSGFTREPATPNTRQLC